MAKKQVAMESVTVLAAAPSTKRQELGDSMSNNVAARLTYWPAVTAELEARICSK